MSELIIEVCRVDAVEPHPNADLMEICQVKGWRTCAKKNQFKPGDKCIYFPPDSILPTALSDKLGITKYLTPVKEFDTPIGGRVRVANLRGYKSFGTIMPVEDTKLEVGTDVAEMYGIKKWEPPLQATDGDAARGHPALHKYHSIENWRNFPDLFKEGVEVVMTEKIHGKNARLGYVRVSDDEGNPTWEWMAGSHSVQRKEFDSDGKRSQFWECYTDELREMMKAISDGKHNVVVFGELFGSGVQDMCYGFKNGEFSFRAFDITVDGVYLDFEAKSKWCADFKVPMVPVLYRGPFSKKVLEQIVDGPTTMCKGDVAGAFKGREGVVITPVVEQVGVKAPKKTFERLILKCVSFDYLNRKGGTEYH